MLVFADLRRSIVEGREFSVKNVTRDREFQVRHSMSPRQVELLLRGGMINWMKERSSDVHEPPASTNECHSTSHL